MYFLKENYLVFISYVLKENELCQGVNKTQAIHINIFSRIMMVTTKEVSLLISVQKAKILLRKTSKRFIIRS